MAMCCVVFIMIVVCWFNVMETLLIYTIKIKNANYFHIYAKYFSFFAFPCLHWLKTNVMNELQKKTTNEPPKCQNSGASSFYNRLFADSIFTTHPLWEIFHVRLGSKQEKYFCTIFILSNSLRRLFLGVFAQGII